LIEVAFKSPESLRVAIKEDRQILGVLHFTSGHEGGNVKPHASSKALVEWPKLKLFALV
jgi:hypothetical protein